jgi:endoplasmic reticulum resident protein 44
MLEQLKEMLSNLIYNKKFLIVVFVAALLTGIAFFIYNYYVAPRLNPSFVENKELVSASDDITEIDIYYFFTEWCPYCKKARPIWDNLKEQYNEKLFNGKTLNFKEVDCEKNEQMADRFNIEGYPTIKLVKGNQVVDYDAKPDAESLKEFLQTSV